MKQFNSIKTALLALLVLLWSGTSIAATISGTVFGGCSPLANVAISITLQVSVIDNVQTKMNIFQANHVHYVEGLDEMNDIQQKLSNTGTFINADEYF